MKMLKISRTLATLLCGALLTACGGGGSSSTPLNVSPGVYGSISGNNETLVVLVRNSGDAQRPNWFGVKFTNGNLDPDFYSGSSNGFTGSTVVLQATKHFQNTPVESTTAGQVTLTMPTQTKLANSLVFSGLNFDWQLEPPSSNQYNFNTNISLNPTGSWTGRWSFATGYSDNQPITFTSGAANQGQSILTGCKINDAQLSQLEASVNVYSFQLTMVATQADPLSNCSVSKQDITFKGLAYISTPSAGRSRLTLMAVSNSGKALFFRGDS